jgi:hypothetical protein
MAGASGREERAALNICVASFGANLLAIIAVTLGASDRPIDGARAGACHGAMASTILAPIPDGLLRASVGAKVEALTAPIAGIGEEVGRVIGALILVLIGLIVVSIFLLVLGLVYVVLMGALVGAVFGFLGALIVGADPKETVGYCAIVGAILGVILGVISLFAPASQNGKSSEDEES